MGLWFAVGVSILSDRLYFMRHGPVEYNKKMRDSYLSDEGKKEVEKAASALMGATSYPQKIFSSPKQRCMETAHIVASMGNLPDTCIESHAALLPQKQVVKIDAVCFLESLANDHLIITHLPNLQFFCFEMWDLHPTPSLHMAALFFVDREKKPVVCSQIH